MKISLKIITAFIISINAIYAQPSWFQEGKIVTKYNDTLNVLIDLSNTYFKKATYKTDTGATVQTMPISQIKQVFTQYNLYENIKVKKTEKMFRYVINDKVSLLKYYELNPGQINYKNGGSISVQNPPTIIYAVKTDKDVIFIKNKKDKDLLIPLCDNCPEVKAFIQSNSFNLEKLDDTVKRINSCNKE
jgi:hypothetical protein